MKELKDFTKCSYLFTEHLLTHEEKEEDNVRTEGYMIRSKGEYIFSSCSFCNKLPQTCWLKITVIYSLTVLEVKNLKSVFLSQNQSVNRDSFPGGRRGPLGRIHFLPPPAPGVCWLVLLLHCLLLL